MPRPFTAARGYLRARAGSRGFSLVELLVVLIVLAVIIPMAVRFTSDSLWFADDQSARARMLQRMDDAVLSVERDLNAARSCRSSLLDPPVISISSTHLEFISDIDGDGKGEYVRYEVAEGEFRRITAVQHDGDTNEDGQISETERCTFTLPENQTTEVLAEVPADVDAFFTARHPVDGVVPTASEPVRMCRDLSLENGDDFDQCDFLTVTVTISQQSLVPDMPDITIVKEIAIDQRWGRT